MCDQQYVVSLEAVVYAAVELYSIKQRGGFCNLA